MPLSFTHRSRIHQSTIAADGILTTAFDTASIATTLSVGIVFNTWPSWGYVFNHVMFDIKWLLCCNQKDLAFLRSHFPAIPVIASVYALPTTLDGVDVLAFNGPLAGLQFPPTCASVCLFDFKFRPRCNWSEWTRKIDSVSHSLVGGCSSHVGMFTVMTRRNGPFPLPTTLVHNAPTTVLSSIMKCTGPGSVAHGPPPLLPAPVLPGQAVSLGRHSFHFKGYYPFEHPSPIFVVPSVFTPSKWVRRSLTLQEMKDVYDLPHQTSVVSQKLLSLMSAPMKSLYSVVYCTFFKDNNSGGEATFSQPLKATLTTGSDTNWILNERHAKKESAVQHDDARVPVEFWNDSLEAELGYNFTTIEHQALDTLRGFILCRWKRSVTKCFVRWMKCKRCHSNHCRNLFEKRFLSGSLLTEVCNKCSITNSRSKQNIVDLRLNKYVWTKGGLERYKRWRNTFLKKFSAEGKDMENNREAGVDCLTRASQCSVWVWKGGSRPFFWRWGEEFWLEARDGARIWIQDKLPKCRKRQRLSSDEGTRKKVIEKISKVRNRKYISKGKVVSLTSFFDVPKGTDDIRMVYNGTSSGLNDAVYCPWFSLPTVESHLRAVDVGTYMGDCDIGDMFLNFMLDKNIRKYAGIDISKLYPEESTNGFLWERWERMLMGFKPSPYCTTRDMKRMEEKLKGRKEDKENVFRWSEVIMNLPGSINYDPSKPWVYRVREDGVTFAADLFTYIDDLRPTAPTEAECWKAGHQIGCQLTWHGIQDAARKRRKPSRTPGAWAGTIIHTVDGAVTVLVSQEKWDKTKLWIHWLKDLVDKGEEISHNTLQKCRGFLIYVSRTYRPMIPFLRGIHMTIDSWRPFRDEDGWKLKSAEIEAIKSSALSIEVALEPGETVKASPRLAGDISALAKLVDYQAPPKVVRRRKKCGMACYGFGDASGSGFGHCLVINGTAYAKYGTWSKLYEGQHSNFKELKNLVEAVKGAYEESLLKGVELFIFTDNFVAESCYYNGGSNKNKTLNALVFELWNIQMKGDFTLHLFHVAGTRMISSGIDGLSRGDKLEGVMRGTNILSFVPIHETPLSRNSKLLNWIHSWWDIDYGKLELLSPEGWFIKAMTKGNFLWNVAPAAGASAVEQLCSHIHGRPDSTHIFIIPRLCTNLWRKQLNKACDALFVIQPKFEFWGENLHEPLLIGIYFPLLPYDYKYRPWKLRRTKLVDTAERAVHGMQRPGEPADWNLLRKLLLQARTIPTMPQSMARRLLQIKGR